MQGEILGRTYAYGFLIMHPSAPMTLLPFFVMSEEHGVAIVEAKPPAH